MAGEEIARTTPVIFSSNWRSPSGEGFAEKARRQLRRHEELGWMHLPASQTILTPGDEKEYDCGCPGCRPDAYGGTG